MRHTSRLLTAGLTLLMTHAIASPPPEGPCSDSLATLDCRGMSAGERAADAIACYLALFRCHDQPHHLYYAAKQARSLGLLSVAHELYRQHVERETAYPELIEASRTAMAEIAGTSAGEIAPECRADAEVTIDEVVVGTCGDGPIRLAAGKSYAIDIDDGLTPPASVAVVPNHTVVHPPSVTDEPTDDVDGTRWAPWTLVGVGAAGLVMGGAMNAVHLARYGDLEDGGPGDRSEDEWVDHVREPVPWAIGGYIGGGLLLAAGVAWLLMPEDMVGSSTIRLEGAGVSVSW